MRTNQSILSRKREEKRNSKETKEFRDKVIDFLETVKASPEIVYSIKKDLSTKTDMEFYMQDKSQDKLRAKTKISRIELAVSYVELLLKYDDIDFSEKLLKKLSVQQNQVFRKLAQKTKYELTKEKKMGKSNGIWEHSIPTKIIINEIIIMIKDKNLNELRRLLELYKSAGQKFITKEQDKILSEKYKECMPESWNWKDNNCDPLARYVASNIKV